MLAPRPPRRSPGGRALPALAGQVRLESG